MPATTRGRDRKSTRLNSSHVEISYAVFCWKKKSHLVRLLNLHPAVFVAHESDVIWILYQMANGLLFHCYPWDGPRGMEATLKQCADLLDCEAVTSRPMTTIPELFNRILLRVMEQGSAVQQLFF